MTRIALHPLHPSHARLKGEIVAKRGELRSAALTSALIPLELVTGARYRSNLRRLLEREGWLCLHDLDAPPPPIR